ncbi:ABC transporter permease [Actinomyces vulturis]|uniref:ABC transporter permease n=1 Tax=Actinomyces vulturis TaxID=1857645 RepID=UPI000AAA3FBE|nr:ABC transporter permease subunit [Actinomyces vulturis]
MTSVGLERETDMPVRLPRPYAGGAQARIPSTHLASARRHRLLARLGKSAQTFPFFAYLAVFLLLPTLIVIRGAFVDQDGAFTLSTLERLADPNVVDAFMTSVLVSAISAFIGTVVGAAASVALIYLSTTYPALRRIMVALCSVLAQFGGVMLAFAFIATVGINGTLTQLLQSTTSITVNPNWLSSLPGLITVYCYFQIPLMIIVFLPALDGLKPQWREANINLGGSSWHYVLHVAGPIVWPTLLGSFLLLFANAFSSFATAAALFAQRSILVPLMIQGALRNEMDTGLNAVAQVLAMAMIIVVALVMVASSLLTRKASQWQ